MTKSLFISHSSKDKRIANELCERLEAVGISCWIAPRDVAPGTAYGEAIVKGIEECHVCLLVLSENANRSEAVSKEIERAFSYQKLIVPLRVREVVPSKRIEFFVSSAQWVDAFSSPVADRIEYLTAVVHAAEMKEPSPPPAPQRKSAGAQIERALEKILRYKLASATVAVALLVGLAVAGLAMQRTTQSVVRSAANEIDKSAQTVTKAGQQLGGVNDKLSTIETGVQESKKETSSDPQEELANLGISWTPDNFNNAVHNNDIRAVRLFLAGGMPWYDMWAEDVALNNEAAVLSALQGRMDLQEDPRGCQYVINDYQSFLFLTPPGGTNNFPEKVSLTPTQASYLMSKCDGPAFVSLAHQNFDQASRNYQTDQKKLAAWSPQAQEISKESIRCIGVGECTSTAPVEDQDPAPEVDVDRDEYYFWKLILKAVSD